MAGTTERLRALGLNLLLMSIAGVVSLGALELGVRIFVDMNAQQPLGVRDVNMETMLSFLPGRERTYETEEFRFTVSTNRFGRRDSEWTPAALADPTNLLMIGDSFVLGNAVENEFSIPSQLEAIYAEAGHPVEVFNFGMPGAAITQYKLNLEEAFGIGVAARTVLINVFVGNDFDPNYLPGKQEARLRAPEHKARPRSWTPRSSLVEFAKRRASQSPRTVGYLLKLGQLIGVRLYSTPAAYVFFRQQTPEQAADFRRMLEVLGEIKMLCDANDRDLYVVAFPNRIQVENHEDLSSETYDAGKPNRLILEYCAEFEVRCLDLLPGLAAEYERNREPLFYPIDRHPNEKGYRLAAEAIARFIGNREPEPGLTGRPSS